MGIAPIEQEKWGEFEVSINLQDTGSATLIALRQLYPSEKSRDEVITKYGAIEGGKQHLAKLEVYVREHLSRIS